MCIPVIDPKERARERTEEDGAKSDRAILRGAVVSDLHMFSSRSAAERRTDEIHRAVEDSDIFVFNGDTFDFRWSRFGEPGATSVAAIEWIADLAARHPDCRFHFVLGNHDANYKFQRALAKLCNLERNLDWHAYYLKVDDTLFLHGDVVERKMNVKDLAEYRRGWQNGIGMPRALARGYGAVNLLGVDRTVCSFRSRSLAVRRILHYLRHVEQLDSLKHVYFGHTHLRFRNYTRQGIQFHNSGAFLRGFRGKPMRFLISRPTALSSEQQGRRNGS